MKVGQISKFTPAERQHLFSYYQRVMQKVSPSSSHPPTHPPLPYSRAPSNRLVFLYNSSLNPSTQQLIRTTALSSSTHPPSPPLPSYKQQPKFIIHPPTLLSRSSGDEAKAVRSWPNPTWWNSSL